MLTHSNVLKLVLQAFSVTSEMNRPSDSISDVCKTSNNTAHRNHECEVFNSQYTVPALFKIVPPSHNQKSVILGTHKQSVLTTGLKKISRFILMR